MATAEQLEVAAELRAEYVEAKEARRKIRQKVQAEFRERARIETEEVHKGLDVEFARLLKDAISQGVPISRIRSDVLGTNSWSRWVYWRDLIAELED